MKLIIVDSEWNVPSDELIEYVQEKIDPTDSQGSGYGIAPIGHVVTVVGATGVPVDVSFTLEFDSGVTWDSVKSDVESAIHEYFDELIQSWSDSDGVVVRIKQIETKILNVSGVVDITNTALNGESENLTLNDDEIPILGAVTNGTD